MQVRRRQPALRVSRGLPSNDGGLPSGAGGLPPSVLPGVRGSGSSLSAGVLRSADLLLPACTLLVTNTPREAGRASYNLELFWRDQLFGFAITTEDKIKSKANRRIL